MINVNLNAIAALKKKKLHEICLSIDLETPNNCETGIFSIGIVPFSALTGECFPDAGFYMKADFTEVVNNAAKAGSQIGDTMSWWMRQSEAARFELLGVTGLNPKGQPLFEKYGTQKDLIDGTIEYLNMMGDCLQTNGRLRPMGNSDLFDIGILENTLRSVGYKTDVLAYDFWNTIDLRTAVYLANICAGKTVKKLRDREGTHHNALDDALMQALWFLDSVVCLGGVKEVTIVSE